jgi:hypothetical protein
MLQVNQLTGLCPNCPVSMTSCNVSSNSGLCAATGWNLCTAGLDLCITEVPTAYHTTVVVQNNFGRSLTVFCTKPTENSSHYESVSIANIGRYIDGNIFPQQRIRLLRPVLILSGYYWSADSNSRQDNEKIKHRQLWRSSHSYSDNSSRPDKDWSSGDNWSEIIRSIQQLRHRQQPDLTTIEAQITPQDLTTAWIADNNSRSDNDWSADNSQDHSNNPSPDKDWQPVYGREDKEQHKIRRFTGISSYNADYHRSDYEPTSARQTLETPRRNSQAQTTGNPGNKCSLPEIC